MLLTTVRAQSPDNGCRDQIKEHNRTVYKSNRNTICSHRVSRASRRSATHRIQWMPMPPSHDLNKKHSQCSVMKKSHSFCCFCVRTLHLVENVPYSGRVGFARTRTHLPGQRAGGGAPKRSGRRGTTGRPLGCDERGLVTMDRQGGF